MRSCGKHHYRLSYSLIGCRLILKTTENNQNWSEAFAKNWNQGVHSQKGWAHSVCQAVWRVRKLSNLKIYNWMTFKKKKCFTDTSWFQVGVHSRDLDEWARQLWGFQPERRQGGRRLLHWLQESSLVKKMLDVFFSRLHTTFVITGSLKAREWTRSGSRHSTHSCLLPTGASYQSGRLKSGNRNSCLFLKWASDLKVCYLWSNMCNICTGNIKAQNVQL